MSLGNLTLEEEGLRSKEKAFYSNEYLSKQVGHWLGLGNILAILSILI